MRRRSRGHVFLISLADLERMGSQAVYDALIAQWAEEELGRVAFLGLDASEEELDESVDIVNEGMSEA